MPDPGSHRGTPGRRDRLWHRPARDEVVHDGRPGFPFEEPPGDEGGRGTPRQRPPLIVDEESPVGVTVEGHAEVGALPFHQRDEIDQVLRVEGIGRVVGEGAVGLQVQRDQFR